MRRILRIVLIGLALSGPSACDSPILGGGLSIVVSGDAFVLTGRVDRRAPDRMAAMLDAWPGVTKVVLRRVPGGRDQAANRRLARMVRAAGLTTIVPTGGLVAAGGTDLFLAGVERIAAFDACIGVRSWAGGMFGVEEGRFLPRDNPEHVPYLEFYRELGVPDGFYWFAISAAGADGMHWMRAIEINHFRLPSRRVRDGPTGAEIDHLCQDRAG